MAENTQKLRGRYPGSIPFGKDDEWVFFGRDDDIEKHNRKADGAIIKIIRQYEKDKK